MPRTHACLVGKQAIGGKEKPLGDKPLSRRECTGGERRHKGPLPFSLPLRLLGFICFFRDSRHKWQRGQTPGDRTVHQAGGWGQVEPAQQRGCYLLHCSRSKTRNSQSNPK